MLNKIKKKFLFIILSLLSTLIIIFFLFMMFHVKAKLTGRTYLNEGFTIVRNGIIYQDVTLSNFHFPIAHKYDKFILTIKLPELKEKSLTLSVPVDHSTIKVSVEGNEVYQYGKDLFQKNILVGSGYHWIPLPSDASGKQLTIELTATVSNSFSQIGTIYYEASDSVHQNFFFSLFPAFFICIFLIGFGFLLLTITIFILYYNRNAIRLVYIALFTIFIALWFGSNYRILQLVGTNYTFNTTFEYMALYLAIVPITLFFREVYKENPLDRKIFNGFGIISTLFVVLSFTLNGCKLMHLTQSLYFFQPFVAIEVIAIGVFAVKALKQKTKEDRLILQGLLILTLFSALDLIRFWFEKFASGILTLPIKSLMPIGVILFVLSLTLSYLYFTLHNITTKAENELLKKLAYTDILTGLSNRTRMDEYLEALTTSNLDSSQPSFAIINMDLNRLKTINDTFGHETGDSYLKRFARLLSECFLAYGEVGRIGGDEFLVVLPNITRERSELLVASLEKNLEEDNLKFPTSPLSFSYGICYSDEFENFTTKKMYRLADDRMYEMKKQYKNNNDD